MNERTEDALTQGPADLQPVEDFDVEEAPIAPAAALAWQDVQRAIAGASEPRNIQRQEVPAAREWVAALEAELAHPATPADLAILGSLVKLALIEWRLARKVFERGIVVKEGGETKATLTELRQVIRLKADLLGKLELRREPKSIPGIRDVWAVRAQEGTGAPVSGGNGHEAPTAPSDATDAKPEPPASGPEEGGA